MGKFLRPGRVVIILQGRFAGRKAVILKSHDDGHSDRKFGHAIVAGIDKYPKKLRKNMREKTIKKRAAVKPFVKAINYLHMMPTRYNLDIHDKILAIVSDGTLNSDEKRRAAMRNVKKTFDERYMNLAKAKTEKAALGAKYFFSKLHF